MGHRLSQTVNGIPTNYTMDLNASLTQVLSDGTYSYTYGMGRISQQQGTTPEYFLGDALGSVRQLTDQSSAITLAKSYDPYGNVANSIGNSTSVFAYTGEQVDANGLVYLRARYYTSSMGRFLTRDTWAGNTNNPISFNQWLYAYGNPIKYQDPSGYVPDETGINESRHVYSCNCGWLDLAHAKPSKSEDIFKLLNARPTIPSNVRIREDALLISLRLKLKMNIEGRQHIVVKTMLSDQAKKEVGLGMFMAREESKEGLQAWAFWAHTSFAEEDLVSDLIGFYMRDLGMTEDARDNDANWRWLAKTCGFPEDKEEAKKWSLDVFESYPGYEQIEEWGNPRLACTNDIQSKCGLSRKWPTVFTTISPQKPSVNGNWWLYRGWDQDGVFLGTEIQDVYFLLERD